jgi:hypothetical protein
LYVGSPYVQRGYGIGSFHASVFRSLKHLAIRGARALGREALKTGAQILADIGNKQSETKVKDVVADRLADSEQTLVTKLKGGGGRKRKRDTSNPPPLKKKKRKIQLRRGGTV